jgi:vacuolar iron transporter family protein
MRGPGDRASPLPDEAREGEVSLTFGELGRDDGYLPHMSTDPAAAPDTPEIGHEHADVAGGWLRPAVFGAMDGLVSNLALIAGVAGGTSGTAESSAVVLAGLAGLAAGAFSMAAGEYTSVASQSEAAQHEIAKERREIVANPEAETLELASMYVEKGLDPALAAEVARQIHRDVDLAVDVHAREELGVDPGSLASPVVAAVSSFLAFAVGAFVPVLPYLLGASTLLPGLVVTLLALFACGAVVTQVTNRSWWFGGLRQLLLGGVAAALTFGFGSLVGTSLG